MQVQALGDCEHVQWSPCVVTTAHACDPRGTKHAQWLPHIATTTHVHIATGSGRFVRVVAGENHERPNMLIGGGLLDDMQPLPSLDCGD